jgi:hypothetical protein
MAANTKLLIKRSEMNNTPAPGQLEKGELAYSYTSNTLFIGADNGSGYNVVGGDGLLASLSANLTLTDASSNTANVNLLTDSLNFRGTGIVSANVSLDMFNEAEVVISLDDTRYISANTGTGGAYGSTQVISTNLQIEGDLIVNGTTTAINSTTVQTGDTILVLANNNTTGDTVDTGFVSRYNDGMANLFSGLVRDSSGSGQYALFQGETDSGAAFTGINIGTLDSSIGMGGTQYATLRANVSAPLVTATQLRTTDKGIQLGNNADAGDTSYGSALSPSSIAIGYRANANTTSGSGGTVAIGSGANYGVTPGASSIAIGTGTKAESNGGIAIGYNAEAAGQDGMGLYGSIVLNADSTIGLTSTQEGFYVNPIREISNDDFTSDNNSVFMTYNSQSKEVRYVHYLDGGSF